MPFSAAKIVSSSASTRKYPLNGADIDTLWRTLAEDSGAMVLVLSPEGKIVAANAYASSLLSGEAAADVSGKRLVDFLPLAVAEELGRCIQETTIIDRPIVIEGMLRGRVMRSVFRAGGGSSSEYGQCVLMTSRVPGGHEANLPVGDQVVRRAIHQDSGQLSVLTSREMDILALIGLGYTTADIAKKLERSVKTVEWHRVALGSKLGVSNRVELARIAIGAGVSRLFGDVNQKEANHKTSDAKDNGHKDNGHKENGHKENGRKDEKTAAVAKAG